MRAYTRCMGVSNPSPPSVPLPCTFAVHEQSCHTRSGAHISNRGMGPGAGTRGVASQAYARSQGRQHWSGRTLACRSAPASPSRALIACANDPKGSLAVSAVLLDP